MRRTRNQIPKISHKGTKTQRRDQFLRGFVPLCENLGLITLYRILRSCLTFSRNFSLAAASGYQ